MFCGVIYATMRTKKNHERAAGMVQTSIAIPDELLEKLSEQARLERRSRNNLIALLLWRAVEDHNLRVAESSAPASNFTDAAPRPVSYKIPKKKESHP